MFNLQRADALRREAWEQNQAALARRDAREAAIAQASQEQAMQTERLNAAAASQRFAADRASSDAYNARNDAYSMATNPELRRARMNEENAMANANADRQANLMGTQARMNVFQNTEAMQDKRQLALTQAQLDSAATMQKGNVDARLLALQGRNQQALAGANGQWDINRDNNKAGLDAETAFRQQRAAIEQFHQQALQTHDFTDQDRLKKDALDQEAAKLWDAKAKGQMTPAQFQAQMATTLGQMGGISPSVSKLTPEQQQARLADAFKGQSYQMADGRVATLNQKTGEWKFSNPPPKGAVPATVGEKPMSLKDYSDAIDYIISTGPRSKPKYKDDPGEPLLTEEQAIAILNRRNAARLGKPLDVPASAVPDAGAPRDSISRWRERLDAMERSQGQQVDPRVEAMSSPLSQQRSDPAIDPRASAMPQGQPPLPAARPQQPHDSPVAARVDALTGRSVAAGDQQTAGALQAFKQIAAKYGGAPPPDSPDFPTFVQAAQYLHARGIDPTGGVRRPAPPAVPSAPGWRRPTPSSRNLAE